MSLFNTVQLVVFCVLASSLNEMRTVFFYYSKVKEEKKNQITQTHTFCMYNSIRILGNNGSEKCCPHFQGFSIHPIRFRMNLYVIFVSFLLLLLHLDVQLTA